MLSLLHDAAQSITHRISFFTVHGVSYRQERDTFYKICHDISMLHHCKTLCKSGIKCANDSRNMGAVLGRGDFE